MTGDKISTRRWIVGGLIGGLFTAALAVYEINLTADKQSAEHEQELMVSKLEVLERDCAAEHSWFLMLADSVKDGAKRYPARPWALLNEIDVLKCFYALDLQSRIDPYEEAIESLNNWFENFNQHHRRILYDSVFIKTDQALTALFNQADEAIILKGRATRGLGDSSKFSSIVKFDSTLIRFTELKTPCSREQGSIRLVKIQDEDATFDME
jgi:hypothetical protein